MNYLDFIKYYEIPISYECCPYQFGNYDGKKINLLGLTEQDILHEIAHYIIATPKQRQFLDYGLGTGQNTSHDVEMQFFDFIGNKDFLLSYKESEEQEELSCIFELILAAISGLSIKQYLRDRFFVKDLIVTYDLVWNYKGKESFNENVKKIKCLITEDWIPIQLLPHLQPVHLQLIIDFKKLIVEIQYA